MDLDQKLMNFSERDWSGEIDFTRMEMVSLPCERRFSFLFKDKEVLSLNISEIKKLSDHSRQYFKRCFSEISEFLMYLILKGNLLREEN